MYTPLIDYDIPLADYSPTFVSLEERVSAAMAALVDTDNLPTLGEISDDAKEKARAHVPVPAAFHPRKLKRFHAEVLLKVSCIQRL